MKLALELPAICRGCFRADARDCRFHPRGKTFRRRIARGTQAQTRWRSFFRVGSRDSSLSKRDWLTLETGKNEEGRRDKLVAEVKALLADASAASKRMISDLPGKLVLRLPNQGRIGILFAVGPVSEND